MTQRELATALVRARMEIVKVRACVNRFLFSKVGSIFSAGEPTLDAAQAHWQVPILMITPGLVVGEVGEAVVGQEPREIIRHTPIKKIHAAAAKLRKKHHAEIEAAFLQARKV